MGCGQMQWNIVAHICCIHTSATMQQHVHQFCVTFFGTPMQRTEAMIIAVKEIQSTTRK